MASSLLEYNVYLIIIFKWILCSDRKLSTLLLTGVHFKQLLISGFYFKQTVFANFASLKAHHKLPYDLPLVTDEVNLVLLIGYVYETKVSTNVIFYHIIVILIFWIMSKGIQRVLKGSDHQTYLHWWKATMFTMPWRCRAYLF